MEVLMGGVASVGMCGEENSVHDSLACKHCFNLLGEEGMLI